MSLRPSPATAVPEETAKVARAAFPRGCLLMDVRDSLGSVFDDTRFARLFSTRGRPAEAPWRLALVTLLQFAENLSDRDAADAVRARLDWKYLLALALDDPGFDSTVLCEFRARLVDGHAEHELLDALLAVAVARRLVRPQGRQRTDSTHVLAAVKMRSRIVPAGIGPADTSHLHSPCLHRTLSLLDENPISKKILQESANGYAADHRQSSKSCGQWCDVRSAASVDG